MQRVLRPECLRRTTTHSLFLSTHTVFLSLESSHILVIADRQSNFYFTKKTDGWKTKTCLSHMYFGRTRITQLCMAEQPSYAFWKWQEHTSSAKCGGVCQESQHSKDWSRGTRSSQSSLATEQVLDQPGLRWDLATNYRLTERERETPSTAAFFLAVTEHLRKATTGRVIWQWSEGLHPGLMVKQQ